VTAAEQRFSSSRIRDLLGTGHPRQAAELLGHWWEIDGRVEQGDRRGRAIGFPTANVALGEFLEPRFGVYAVRAGIDEEGPTAWRDGVANIGHRPTFGVPGVTLEVHCFDFAGDLYGKHLRVAFVDFLRLERKFDGIAALKAQIGADAAAARKVLAAPENAAQRFGFG
jgi:riboflavin kinase/FMN adenylyltransferase